MNCAVNPLPPIGPAGGEAGHPGEVTGLRAHFVGAPGERSPAHYALLAGAVAGLMALGGCASWFVDDPPPFERMLIKGKIERDDDGLVEGDFVADTTIKGALIGGGSGFVTLGGAGLAFAAFLSAGCWIFYAGCLLVFGLIFGGGGAIVGLISGSIIGGIGGLPSETVDRINPILADIHKNRDFAEDLGAATMAKVPKELQLGSSGDLPAGDAEPRAPPALDELLFPDAVIVARLDDVDLRQHSSERLSMRLRATMVVKWDLDEEDKTRRECGYVFTSETLDVEDWLLNDGRLFDDTISTGIHRIAGWMAKDLHAFRTQTEFDETDDDPESCFRE